MLAGRRHWEPMVVAYGSEQGWGTRWGKVCGRGSLCSRVELGGERVGKKTRQRAGRPLFCFVAYCGCNFMLRRKDPINLSFP